MSANILILRITFVYNIENHFRKPSSPKGFTCLCKLAKKGAIKYDNLYN